MRQTAIGPFTDSGQAEKTVHDLTAAGIPAGGVQVLAEPRRMSVSGMLSTPDNDFRAALRRDLRAMGATEAEAQSYVEGVGCGGALVLVSGSVDQVQKSAEIMSRDHAGRVDELIGSDSVLAGVGYVSSTPMRGQSAKDRSSVGGARIFVW